MRCAELLLMSAAVAISARFMVRCAALKARSTARPFSSDWLKRELLLSLMTSPFRLFCVLNIDIRYL